MKRLINNWFLCSIYVIILTFSLILTSCNEKKNIEGKKIFRIGITQNQQTTWADQVRTGFLEGLNNKGLSEGKDYEISYVCADGDIATMSQIANKFVLDRVDLIFPISTQSAQTALQNTNTIPIVFGAITDPVKARLVKSWEKPGGNVTGTSDIWPFKKQFELIAKILPNAKRIGVIHNPSEANSEACMIEIRKIAQNMNLSLVETSVNSTNEVQMAAKSLVGKCDCFYIAADNTVIQAVESVLMVADDNNIPVFPGESYTVEKGALATYSFDYHYIGLLSGEIAYKVLYDKKNPGDIPVVIPPNFDLIINLKNAEKLNIKIPDDLLKEAKKLIQ